MGAPIARNILAAGVPLTLWNRTAQKAMAIAGGHVVEEPADAAKAVVLTVLPDLPRGGSCCLHGSRGLLRGWRNARIENPVLVIHGTVSPVAVAAFAEECRRDHGVTVVDAPLSGGTIGAEERAAEHHGRRPQRHGRAVASRCSGCTVRRRCGSVKPGPGRR